MSNYYIYILASQPQGTLYIGVTNDLIRRVYEHREGVVDGFTKTYHGHRLVYFEEYADVRVALQREKNLKRWRRSWKRSLIEACNPDWTDLYPGLLGGSADARVEGTAVR